MAEVTAFRDNALPYPVYGAPWTIVFPILDADGDPVTGAACDSEISQNGDTAVDCTHEGTEIPFDTAGNKGMYYLTLTVAEMKADVLAITIHPDSGKATCIVLYPRKLVPLRADTAGGGDADYIILDAGAGKADGLWAGCLCVATIDGTVEARIIEEYVGDTQFAYVTPDWVTAVPDSNDSFVLYLPEGRQVPQSNLVAMNGDDVSAADLQDFADAGYIPGTHKVAGVVLVDAVTTVAKLLAYVQLLARKDAAIAADLATEVAEINADEGSGAGAFDNQADSVEAIRDRGDAAWTDTTAAAAVGALYIKLLAYVQLLARKDAAIAADLAAEVAEINADEGSGAGAFDNQTEALEAIRDRGDAEWTGAVAPADMFAYDIDSTGGGAVTVRKALEAILAILGGKASHTAATGVTEFKGRDGTTVIVESTSTHSGNRTGSTIN